MPYTRRRKVARRVARRGIKRVGYKKRFKRKVNRVPSGVAPYRMFVKLKGTERTTMSASTGLVAQHLFRGNSLYDPDYTGAGGVPVGFDNLSRMYERYRVYGCKLKLTFVNQTGTAVESPYEICIVPVANGFASTPSPEAARGNPSARFSVVGMNTGSGGVKSLKAFARTSTVMGVSKRAVSSEDNFSADIGANPPANNTWYWYVLGQSTDHASTINLTIYAQFTWYCVFEKRKAVTV